MISIIICTIKPELLSQLSRNIAETIGCPYEIIAMDNSLDNKPLCKVYNYGASRAKYEYLVFVHEDVLFKTENWGQPLSDLLKEQETGLIGVSGAIYKSAIPSPWSAIPSEYYRTNSIQRRLSSGCFDISIIKDTADSDKSQVVVLDGCFLAMRKEVWNDFRFNEEVLKGFHFYDMDISLRVGSKFKLYVQHRFVIEHLSEGSIDKLWLKEALLVKKYFMKILPAKIGCLENREENKVEYMASSAFVWACLKNSYFCIYAVKLFLYCLVVSPFNKNNVNMVKFLLKNL